MKRCIHRIIQFGLVALGIMASEAVAESSREVSKYIARLSKAASQGDVNSQWEYGLAYEVGNGVEQSFAKAAEWYSKAAEKGHADALNSLGLLYVLGKGVPEDDGKAKELFGKAAVAYTKKAESGDSVAQFTLGRMYATGTGVSIDKILAAAWFILAAGNGNSLAISEMGKIEKKFTPEELALAKATSAKLVRIDK